MGADLATVLTAMTVTFGTVAVWGHADRVAHVLADLILGAADGMAAASTWCADRVADLLDLVRSL